MRRPRTAASSNARFSSMLSTTPLSISTRPLQISVYHDPHQLEPECRAADGLEFCAARVEAQLV